MTANRPTRPDSIIRFARASAALAVSGALLAGPAFAQDTAPHLLAPDPDCLAPPDGVERPWLNASADPICRATWVLEALPGVDDRLELILGSGFGAGGGRDVMGELGLTTGRTQDGPAGFEGGTAWPTPITIAASFDPDLAGRYGQALGREFFESGRNGILGPAYDIARTWRFGRGTESFGEDPWLQSRMAARQVAAIQGEHVLTTMKHYAIYTQEQGRLGDNPIGEGAAIDQIISERAMREIYLPAFRAAVTEAGAGGVMCSFPQINGTYACEHDFLLNEVLKGEWGFEGVVAPDFPVAQRSIVEAVNSGLDSGVFDPDAGNGSAAASAGRFAGEISLREAVANGEVSEARITDMVMRRLVPGFRIGTFDNPAEAVREEPSTEDARALAARIVQAGAVLLKNDGALPLAAEAGRIALIGPQAGPEPAVTEQGSPSVSPRHVVTMQAAMEARAGDGVEIFYEPGIPGLKGLPAPAEGLLTAPDGTPGLLADYFAGPSIAVSGAPVASRVEPGIAMSGLPDLEELPADKDWAVRWRGSFTPDQAGLHRFTLEGSGSAELYLDGALQDGFHNADFGAWAYAGLELEAGQSVEIEVRYSPRVTLGDDERNQFGTIMGTALRLGHQAPAGELEKAVAAASEADVAIVFAGQIIGEGWDREHLALPAGQDALIAAVAAANPNTVVVLTTGGAVAMPWLEDVAGVLEVWLPGDAYGTAVAGLLFGDADPGGRLPVTFPADETQGPGTTQETYPGTLSGTGAVETVRYDEELLVGYRYWDAMEQEPLFPFGYGLSYADFALMPANVSATPNGGALATGSVENIADRAGVAVVQIYVGFPDAAGEPPKQLKGVASLDLAAGASADWSIALPPEAFEYWDVDSGDWRIAPGEYSVMVGTSSRDIAASYEVVPTR